MKSFVCIFLIIALAVCDAAVTSRHGQVQVEGVEGVEGVNEHVKETAAEAEVDSDVVRFRKSPKSIYGGGGSYGPPMTYTYQSPAPTVPCGKNLLISCQPNVAPVPCMASAPAPSYSGYSGAYSEPVPTYAVPHFHGHVRQLRHYGYY